jgi:hypothetical protein
VIERKREEQERARKKMFWSRRDIIVLIYEKTSENDDDDGEQTNDKTSVVTVEKRMKVTIKTWYHRYTIKMNVCIECSDNRSRIKDQGN